MGTKSSMSLVRTTPSTPSVERVRRKNCLPDCSNSMEAILMGAGKCFGMVKTGFWNSGIAESLSSAAGTGRGEAASRVAVLTKLRRFIGLSIARGGVSELRSDAQGGALCHLLDQLLLAEPVDQDVAEEAGVVGEQEAGGAQVLRGGLIGGGEIADRQGVVAAGFDVATAEHHGGQIAALEGAGDDAVVEGHDVPDVTLQE